MDRKIAIILSSRQILRALTEAIIVRRISTYYEILIILSMIILYFDFELVLIKKRIVHKGGEISCKN